MKNSLIGWTTHTWNPWWGCNRVSPECRYCYIGPIMRRGGKEPFGGPMRTSPSTWRAPYIWDRAAASSGNRRRVFTCSMSDFFHPGADAWREDAWHVIRNCQHLDWLLLTKRPERIADRLPADWGDGWPHVWLGVTCGLPASLARVEQLVTIHAALRFISAEPLLGPLDFRPYLTSGAIGWVITGCENTHRDKRRQMDMDWVRDIDQQCRDHGVPHFFKQRYEGTQLVSDGLLDGRVRQEIPRVIKERQ